MDTQRLMPPLEMLEDCKALQATLRDDASGSRTRAIADYLRQAVQTSQEMQLHADSVEAREFAGLVNEAFHCAQRIVHAAWERAHDRSLPG